jgi:3',5'-cyclic AMP phosphodiesterase CpdA
MRTIAHLSDLHFGRTDPLVAAALLADLERRRPDLVIISGDLTQRARSHQFAEARAFLSRVPAPVLVVPGNHDLAPLYRPLDRLFRPRHKFRRHLPDHHSLPVFQDGEVVAIGLDSTRALRWQSGRLKDAHLDHVERILADAPAESCKATFLHHPLPTGHPFEALAVRGIDLVLTGHVHRAHVELIVGPQDSSLVLVQASTACSTRLRDDANGYCLVRVAMPQMEVMVQGWSGEAFHTIRHYWFEKGSGSWRVCPRPEHHRA